MTRSLSALFLTALIVGCTPPDDTEEPADTNDDTTDEPMDIVDIAVADGNFETLTGALVDAGLDDDLRGDGPFTVFAPTDDAFAALDLSGVSTAELAEILQYHVVSGEVPSDQVPNRANSLNSYTIFFDTTDGVGINTGITVTTADIEASNGIIHVIDAVMTPPTIVDAAGHAGLTGLTGAVGAADPAVAELLSGEGDFTVFAPDNQAFDAISDVTAGLSQAELTGILTYHVVGASVDAASVPGLADSLLQNEWGNGVTMLFDTSSGVTVNGSATVTSADIYTTNGIIHVVDEVLLPPTVVDHAIAADLTSLLDTVDAASGDLGTTLASAGPFTVFAPTNQAFSDISDVAAGLSADQLEDVLLYHVADADVPVLSTDLASGEVDTLYGETVTVDVSSGVRVDDASVVTADINATNGVVHVIDAVLVPDTL